MIKQATTLYLFVIDTDSYAGNFERELCAYVTGQTGDCEVGIEMANIAKQEAPSVVGECAEIVEQVTDEHGCYRPVAIYPNPLYGNNGLGKQTLLTETNREEYHHPAYNSVAIYFHTIPSDSLIAVMKERVLAIAAKGIESEWFPALIGYKQGITITGFR